jgi:hypothetical protein
MKPPTIEALSKIGCHSNATPDPKRRSPDTGGSGLLRFLGEPLGGF